MRHKDISPHFFGVFIRLLQDIAHLMKYVSSIPLEVCQFIKQPIGLKVMQ
jgi:hypothetical protein